MSFLAFLEQEVSITPPSLFFSVAVSIPSDAYDFTILREEVVPSTSNITINLDMALRTDICLIAQLKILVPEATVSACLGGSRFLTFDDMSSWISCRR